MQDHGAGGLYPSGGPGGMYSGGGGGAGSPQQQQPPLSEGCQISVPNSAVGAIIGAGGSNIKQIIRDSNAFVTVSSILQALHWEYKQNVPKSRV